MREICRKGRLLIVRRLRTSRKILTPGSMAASWRLMVAHWSCPESQVLRANTSTTQDSRRCHSEGICVQSAHTLRKEHVPLMPRCKRQLGRCTGPLQPDGGHARGMEDLACRNHCREEQGQQD